MRVTAVRRYENHLPEDDFHPYRTGAWRPNRTEYDATELDVVAGELPQDLRGVYLRNTENPLFPSIAGKYHPFDGDGMLHAVHFHQGGASYRNRMVRTQGLELELAAGAPQWAGILEDPRKTLRPEGWGARGRMKDASSTDVVVHRNTALTTFYQCGDAYRFDPRTLEQQGKETWGGDFPSDWGISAHPRVDERTGELLFFSYSKEAPHLSVGVVNPEGRVSQRTPVPLPGPRLPHDLAFTENFIVVNDFPMFWDPERLAQGRHTPRYDPSLPSRFGLVPREGGPARWFEASPTYCLHFANAYEDGDEVVLDGFFQKDPMPSARPDDLPWTPLLRSLDMHALGTRLHRWRFNLRTGTTLEAPLDDTVCEFPSIHGGVRGRKHRYVYSMVGEPGWFLFSGMVRHDLETGATQRYDFPSGVFASEAPVAPRVGSTHEADAYLVTFVSDLAADGSECQVFDARDLARGPICRLRLPERICAGTHAFWTGES